METTPLTSVDEDARRQFEAAWREGRHEPVEKFLPPQGHPQFLATLEELILIEMEMAWKRFGSANTGSDVPFLPLVEQYLMRFPAMRANEIALRLVRQEFLVRQRFGDRPEPGEYKARFPQLVQTGQEVETLAAGDHVPAPMPIIPGYDILEELGHGGMGVVYKAKQHSLKRLVALKMILSARATDQDLARFRIETEAVAQLQHPNIAQIYEVGEYGRRPFCSLEFVDGGSLAQKIAGTPQPAQSAATIVEQLARAVQSAHDKGIIHRDLKPANVLLTAAGLPKITDFGLAKRLEGDSSQTQSGTILGTPSYMAPEQAAGGRTPVGQPADVYGLGAVLYELLTGRPPFKAETVFDTLQQVLTIEPVPPRRLQPKVPRDLETICLTCLRKEPHRRYASSAALAEDLGRFLRGEPIMARPVGRIEQTLKWAKRRPAAAGLLVAVVLLVAGGVAGLFVWQQEEQHRLQREHEYEQGQLQAEQKRLQKEREYEQAQAKEQQHRLEVLAALRTGAAADEVQAQKETHAGRFDEAERMLQRSVKALAAEPLLADRQTELEAKRKRAKRVNDFYRLSDRAQWLGFNDMDTEAMAACQLCLKAVGIPKNGKGWPIRLDQDWLELNPSQRERLRKDINGSMMLWAMLRVRQGLVIALDFTSRKEDKARAQIHFQNALELFHLIEDSDRWHVGRLGKLACRHQLKMDNSDLAALPKGEPFNGYDCYAMGMLHFWIAVRTESFVKLGVKLDTLTTFLKNAMGDYKGLDMVKPRETADLMLRQATKLEPDHYWSHFWLGWSYLETDPPQWHAAEMAFSKCIEIRPQFAFGYGERGLLRFRLWSDARDDLWRRALQHHGSEDLRQALRLSPDDPTIHWIHARANEFLGKRPEMVAHCAQAVELEAPLKSLDGRSLERNSTLAEGVKKFLEDRLSIPKLGMDAEAIIAQAWWVLANEQNALDVALKVLKADPKQPRALAVRGAVMLRRSQLKEALSDFDAALDKMPTLFLANAGRGRALELLDRHQDALDNYDKVLTAVVKTDWQRLEGHLGRARALAALGRVDDAQAALEHAEEIMPGITDAVGKK